MKRVQLSILLLLAISPGYAQLLSSDQIDFLDFVECYYPNDIGPLVIYQGINGKAIDTLENDSKRCYYKMAIQTSKEGWLQIENLLRIPDCDQNHVNEDIYQYKNRWVKSDAFLINLPEGGAYLFMEPNKASPYIRVEKFARGSVVEVKGVWAKVRITDENNQPIEGWLKRSDQCAFPFTTCNWIIED